MLTSETAKRLRSSMKSGNLDYCDVLREAGIHRTDALSNKRAIFSERELV